MNEAPQGVRPSKFKHTRELVRLALNDGMTQDEIGRLCRVQQSVVSGWANGKSKAKEEVLKPLLTRYGHRLNRTSARMLLIQGTPEVPWEETDEGRFFTRLLNDPEGYIREFGNAEEIRELDDSIRRELATICHTPGNRKQEAIAREEARRFAHQAARAEAERLAEENYQSQLAARETAMAEYEAAKRAPVGAGRLPRRPVVMPERRMVEMAHFTERYGSEDYLPATDAQAREAISRIQFSRLNCISRPCKQLRFDWDEKDMAGLAAILRWEHNQKTVRLVRIEGAQLWQHRLGSPELIRRREGLKTEYNEVALRTNGRWIVMAAGVGEFRLLVQRTRWLLGSEREHWNRSVIELPSFKQARSADPSVSTRLDTRVRSNDEMARWIGTLHGPFDIAGLLEKVDELLLEAGPHDRATVPFTLRRALVEHGYDVPGVETLTD